MNYLKNLVIIGASGFIGTNLLKKWNNKENKIIAVSLNMSDFPFFLESENIKYKESLTDYIAINLAYTRSIVL